MQGYVSSFFEGAEKKVEIAVRPDCASFRGLGDVYWRDVARRAGAEVLSKISNPRCDAYLLSESSLLVFDHKVVMMTCGRTTLHEAVLAVLELVTPADVLGLVYERKNEVYPRDQPTSFFHDVQTLGKKMPGRAFQFGNEDEHHLYLFHLDRATPVSPRSMTLEVLMHGVADPVREQFDVATHPTTEAVREATGVHRIVPGFQVDDHLFHPQGYSLNAIRDDEYYTIHVTPEKACSYVSFETNHRFDGNREATIGRLLCTFRPRSFDLVIFDQSGEAGFQPPDYRLRSHVEQDLEGGHRVRYLNFYRPQVRARRAIELPVRRKFATAPRP